MDEKNSIQLFEDRKIRTAWDEEQEEWYFSVQDVVAVLAESSDPKQYIKKMRARDPELSANWGTICTLVRMTTVDGKMRKIQAANTEGLLRIIQSIPSPKAEPFKRWLAQVGRERIEETIDPEQAIDRALETYQKKVMIQIGFINVSFLFVCAMSLLANGRSVVYSREKNTPFSPMRLQKHCLV